ncbi:MAG: saccharopine dehydrogenase NADP-binding domain-containing protein [Saprospiraceae bacterium]|nr:saccharopine dehydrogenase NADP-binding domain-containing protein [Saprospiraceae bacterium]
MDKKYDITLFGATGFTGQIISKYLAEKSSSENIIWAIAGRNEAKLIEVQKSLHGVIPDIVIADVKDKISLSEMCRQSRVLMNAVGPFNWYGLSVVESCIQHNCHYLDITGEPTFVHDCFVKYHQKAEENNITVVNCCGFDSIPADFATWVTVQKLPVDQPKSVRCFVRTNATFSGGTLTTAINALYQQSKGRKASLKYKKNPLAPVLKRNIHFNPDINGWAIPMPVVDPHIVKRSAFRMPEIYGEAFSYGQFFVRSSFGKVVKTIFPIVIAGLMVRFKFFRDWLYRKFKPGTGPSETRRNISKFEVICIGELGNLKVKTVFSGGDPGYDETAKMFSQSAFCILNKQKENSLKFGVLTPVEALNQELIHRLKKEGIVID